MKRVLIISTHPDDETLGCGGTLLNHSLAGDAIYWLIATEGYKPQWSEEMLGQKAAEVDQVERHLAVSIDTVGGAANGVVRPLGYLDYIAWGGDGQGLLQLNLGFCPGRAVTADGETVDDCGRHSQASWWLVAPNTLAAAIRPVWPTSSDNRFYARCHGRVD